MLFHIVDPEQVAFRCYFKFPSRTETDTSQVFFWCHPIYLHRKDKKSCFPKWSRSKQELIVSLLAVSVLSFLTQPGFLSLRRMLPAGFPHLFLPQTQTDPISAWIHESIGKALRSSGPFYSSLHLVMAILFQLYYSKKKSKYFLDLEFVYAWNYWKIITQL